MTSLLLDIHVSADCRPGVEVDRLLRVVIDPEAKDKELESGRSTNRPCDICNTMYTIWAGGVSGSEVSKSLRLNFLQCS